MGCKVNHTYDDLSKVGSTMFLINKNNCKKKREKRVQNVSVSKIKITDWYLNIESILSIQLGQSVQSKIGREKRVQGVSSFFIFKIF